MSQFGCGDNTSGVNLAGTGGGHVPPKKCRMATVMHHVPPPNMAEISLHSD